MSLLTSAATVALGIALPLCAGCSTLDRAFNKEVTVSTTPVARVVTNTVVATNYVAQIVERTNVVLVTNAATGGVSGYVAREPVATNLVSVVTTNLIPVWETNLVTVSVTNLVSKPEAEAVITGVGSVVNTFAPGIGSIVALALGGLYHGYRQVRNKKVNEALIQGVETARAVLESTPQGQAADASLVSWLVSHQKEAGVLGEVSGLVDRFADNPAAKQAAAELMARLLAAQALAVKTAGGVAAAVPPAGGPGCASGHCFATVPAAPTPGCPSGHCVGTVPANA